MRFSSRYGVLKNTQNRIISFTTAAVIAVASLSGAAPLFLSQKALAATGATFFVRSDGNDNCDGRANAAGVSGTCAKLTIQGAVDAAINGDTINIADGTYTEAVTITESLTIVGESKIGTIIKAPNTLTGSDAIVKVSGAGVSTEIRRLTVTGPGPTNCGSIYAGIYVTDNGYADLRNLNVTSIRDAVFSGCQNGRAIYVGGASVGKADITNVSITDYQKGGIYVSNVGSSATVTNSTIVGAGATTTTAQNGMAAINGAQLNVVNSNVRQNNYTPASNIATGILFYYASLSSWVDAASNIRNNEVGVYTTDADLVSNIDLAATTNNLRNAVTNAIGLSAPSSTYVVDGLAGTANSDGSDIVSTDWGNRIYDYNAFSAIPAAVSAVTSGGAVHVAGGNYTGNVTINKSVSLVGPNSTVNPVTSITSRVTEAVITGQVSVYASDVSVKGFTITNPSWNGATIKGVHVYNDGPSVIDNITVANNILADIHNSNNKGAYGVMVQGVTSDVNVSNNQLEDITSAGWAHAIEVTPTGSNPVVPQYITIAGNSFSGITNASGTDQYDFSVDTSGSVMADASKIDFDHNMLSGKVRNLDTNNSLDAAANWWGQASGPAADQTSGLVTVAPWCDSEVCDAYASSQAIKFSASGGVANTPNVVTTIVGSSSAGDAYAVIPASTTITSSDPAWDGTLLPLTVANVSVPGISGFTTSTALAIKIGSDTSSLTFDQPVRLVLPGQAGKLVGFQAYGGSFTEIDTVCTANDASGIPAGKDECKINDGNDLVIWTTHFTAFTTFTRTPVQQTSQSSSSSSTSTTAKATVASITGSATRTAASVLGIASGTSSDATKTPATTNKTTEDKKDDSSAFLGLGWYWLIVLAAVGALGYLYVVRRADRA